MSNYDYEENPTYVMVDGVRIKTTEVETLNIEEDISGRDLLTFEYNGQTYKSYVFTR
jgi:hypothetical protein